ncbi:hypothetical protein FOA52_003615 [Chlamydomonas sp. UWO 241]|nr:hypothetical protein FOA52_003615 [Chlamydomonas sp. UWO 241]
MTLQLSCGAEVPVLSLFLQVASPFFRDNLEDMKGGAPIPVDGSLGLWTYILSYLYPEHDPPGLSLSSVYMLLPVVHKYDFPRLLARLLAFMKGKMMFGYNPLLAVTRTVPKLQWDLEKQGSRPTKAPHPLGTHAQVPAEAAKVRRRPKV